MAFDAFVSYSHAADGQLAPALQRALQRFAKPWFRLRALRVFRDESALSASPHLWSSIQTALDESAWFILLASPDAVRSEWVAKELDYWLQSKSGEQILVVLTDGTWEWDSGAAALAGTAVPAALRDFFTDEPRHLDLRWAHASTDLDLQNARYRDAVAQLAAPIHGVAKDQLESEDIVLHRRARRLARGGVSVLALLLVVALVASGIAIAQRRSADTQRDRANGNAAIADAERLAALSTSRRGTDDTQALLLAVEGYRKADTTTTRAALLGAVTASPQLVGFMPGPADATASTVSPDGRLVVAGTNDGALRFWEAHTTANASVSVAPPAALRDDPVVDLAFDHDGGRLFVLYRDGRVEVWNPATRRPIGAPLAVGGKGSDAISVSADGREVEVADGNLAATGNAALAAGAVYDVAGRRSIGELPDAGKGAFSAGGTTLYASAGLALNAYDARTLIPEGGPIGNAPVASDFCVTTGCFSEAGGSAVASATTRVGGSDHDIVVMNEGAGANASSTAAFVAASLGATVFDATTRRVVESLAPTLNVSAVAIADDARYVVLGGDDGSITVYPESGAALSGPAEATMHQGGRIVSLTLAADGTELASTAVGGSTVLWNLDGRGALAAGHALPVSTLFDPGAPRSCGASAAPVDTVRAGSGGSGLFANDTCTAAFATSASGTDVAVSAAASSVWNVASDPARLVRSFGRAVAPTATPLAFDPTGTRILFATGFSLPSTQPAAPGRIGGYETAGLDGQGATPVLAHVSVVSDPNSGPYVLVASGGSCCAAPLAAMDVWTGHSLGSIRMGSVIDRLVRARQAEVFDTPQLPSGVSTSAASGPPGSATEPCPTVPPGATPLVCGVSVTPAGPSSPPGVVPPTSTIRSTLTALPQHAIVDAQGRRAVTVSAYGDVVLWDLRTGAALGAPIIATGRETPAATAVAFSPDGLELAVGRVDGSIERYAVPSLRALGPPIAAASAPVGQITYQAPGSLIAVASAAAVALIDRSTAQVVASIPYAGPSPLEAAFGSDQANAGDGSAQFGDNGRLLVTSGLGAAPALAVSMVASDWVTAACAAAGRNLTRTEWSQLVGPAVPYDRTCAQWPSGP